MKPTATAPDHRLPRYLQVRDLLMQRVVDRVWKAGEALPAEDRLAQEYAVSLGTMRKALDALVADGVVERHQGRGTFVTRAFERATMLRFVRFRPTDEEKVPVAAILQVAVADGPEEPRQGLRLSTGEKMLYIHRTRSLDGELLLVEHIWLPYRRFSKLQKYLADHSPPLLYPVYDTVCGVVVSRAVDSLSVCALPDRDAEIFGVPHDTLAVKIERTMYDHTASPVEWRASFMPHQRFQYTVEIR